MTQSPLVLIVDDEPVLRDTLVLILESEGFRAISAADGVAAVRLASELQPDLVLCDMIMPGKSGIDVALEIQRMLPSVAVILFSGQASAGGHIETINHSDHTFVVLRKPIRPEHLISALRQQLNAVASQ